MFKNIDLYSDFAEVFWGDSLGMEGFCIEDLLRKAGYSEKAIKEILEWYGFLTEKTPKNLT